MDFFTKLTKIPRQVIYVVIALAVMFPLIIPLGLPIRVMPKAEKLYTAIDSLGARSKPILISCDFDPQSMPELYPMLIAVLRHCFARDIRVVVMALWPQGPGLAEMALGQVSGEYDKAYGKDYAFLGYKFGVTAILLGMGDNIKGVFPVDYYGTSLDSIEITSKMRNYNDLSMVVTLSAGDPGWRAWLLYAQARYHAPVGIGVTAVSAADVYPYVETGQVVGLLAGMKGASEYEILVHEGKYSEGKRTAVQGMDAQSLGHLIIMVFIIIGNIGYFATRRKK
ncbi:MAG: hypothetical protein WBB37_06220 [bacterium]